MIVADLETEHYRFVTVAESREAAARQLALAFSDHLVTTTPGDTITLHARERFLALIGTDLDDVDVLDDDVWQRAVVEWYGVHDVDLAVGQVARDWEVLA